jgi:hypothetical protein
MAIPNNLRFSKSTLLVYCTFIFVFFLCCCNKNPAPVYKKKLSHPNSTSLSFNFPENQLRDTILKLFDIEPQMDDQILKSIFMDEIVKKHRFQVNFVSETANNAVFGDKYFKSKGNIGDIFLFPMGSYWASPMYFRNGEPFLFSTSFAIKFKAISQKQTLVVVEDINPEILNGTKCCGPEGNYSVVQKVAPTTIEEYTLLLYITKKLGIYNLPPVQLPK